MLKKLILAAAALALSAPAFADNRDHRPGYHGYHGSPHHTRHYRHYQVYRPYHPHRPVVVVHRPAPVVQVHSSHPHAGPVILFGAVLGAAIAHHVITGH